LLHPEICDGKEDGMSHFPAMLQYVSRFRGNKLRNSRKTPLHLILRSQIKFSPISTQTALLLKLLSRQLLSQKLRFLFLQGKRVQGQGKTLFTHSTKTG